ncbi:hypothetical protein D3C79_847960 [compost metagenome]
MQAQCVGIGQLPQLCLDTVGGGGQKRQGVAQHGVMRLEALDVVCLFLERLLVVGVGLAPCRVVTVLVAGFNAFESPPQALHLDHWPDQGVVVVVDAGAGLEYFVFPLRVVLLDLPDQVTGLGVGTALVGLGHQVQVDQHRGQQHGTGRQQQQAAAAGQSHRGLPSHSPVRVFRN